MRKHHHGPSEAEIANYEDNGAYSDGQDADEESPEVQTKARASEEQTHNNLDAQVESHAQENMRGYDLNSFRRVGERCIRVVHVGVGMGVGVVGES